MAAKSRKISIAAIALITISIAALILVPRFQNSTHPFQEDEKFISTYIKLAVAREIVNQNPDSLSAVFEMIFNDAGVDSTWMIEYIESITGDADRHKRIWDRIVEKLDSLKRHPAPDTTFDL